MKFHPLILIAMTSLFTLTACGGGSGGDSSTIAFTLWSDTTQVNEGETLIINFEYEQTLVDPDIEIESNLGVIDQANQRITFQAYQV